MNIEQLFEKLWKDYTEQNPSALKIYDLFAEHGNKVVNDHIAFRTFNDKRMNLDVLALPFLKLGYVPVGEYNFTQKHLHAKHFELPGEEQAPRVFISELLLEEFSDGLQALIRNAIKTVDENFWKAQNLIFSGSVFRNLSHEVYEKLRTESEYAAWLYVHGFRANHFTVNVNFLSGFDGIEEVNKYLIDNGFIMNTSGGEVKGSREQLLKQSSTMAEIISKEFREGIYDVPACYYEFAERFEDSDGNLFSGFISGSADKIFESTNFYKK